MMMAMMMILNTITIYVYYDEVSVYLSRKMITSYPPELRAGGAKRKPARPCRLCPSKVDDMVDDNDDYGDDMVLVEKFIPMQYSSLPHHYDEEDEVDDVEVYSDDNDQT